MDSVFALYRHGFAMRATAQASSKPVAAAAGGCETVGWRGTVQSEMHLKTGGIEQRWHGDRAKGKVLEIRGQAALDLRARLRVERHNGGY
jgi:hypothetical protein